VLRDSISAIVLCDSHIIRVDSCSIFLKNPSFSPHLTSTPLLYNLLPKKEKDPLKEFSIQLFYFFSFYSNLTFDPRKIAVVAIMSTYHP
jgi:hypothetical protein